MTPDDAGSGGTAGEQSAALSRPHRPSSPTTWASVVVPAHDEERSIGRLLSALTSGEAAAGLEIVVVCNGCTDQTSAVAASFPGVVVVSTPVASKRAALALGDGLVTAYPRLYVDADVVIDAESVRRLTTALATSSLLAVAPERHIPRSGVPRLVRWYYDVWEELPSVRAGLFGRGVIALSEAGHERIRRVPSVMADDLAFSEAFLPAERAVVDAQVVVYPPRRLADLMRRRVRSHTGVAQSDASHLRSPQTRTAARDLAQMCARPGLAVRMPAFLGITLIARTLARSAVRREDFSTWLRDESSRTPEPSSSEPEPAGPLLVWQAGVSWDAVTGTDRQMVTHLGAAGVDVLWVDPPLSVARASRSRHRWFPRQPRVEQVTTHVWRTRPLAPPFPHRVAFEGVTAALVGRNVRRAAAHLARPITTVVSTSPHPRLDLAPGAWRVYFATDDFTAGAALMREAPRRVARLEQRRVAEADAVAAVSPEILARWSTGSKPRRIIPNGADPGLAQAVATAPAPADLALPGPIAGLVGQLTPRIDLALLESVADRGMSLLLVGPRQATFAVDRLDRLLARPNVQWVGQKPVAELPSYLRVIDVGLTPYVDDAFNRASFPLKTLEYLAAGKPVVSTPLPSVARLHTDLITTASGPEAFGTQVEVLLSGTSSAEDVRRRQAFGRTHGWPVRVAAFCELLPAAARPRDVT